MPMDCRPTAGLRILCAIALALLVASACGDAGDPGAGGSPADCDVSYESTYAAVHDRVFVRYGCDAEACHGSATSGGLDLRFDNAVASLVEVPSAGRSSLPRIDPGNEDRSYLWWKVYEKANPGSFEINGGPMPVGPTALSDADLNLLRVWIKNGAPESGVVEEAVELIDACLPPAEPITIKPLSAPPTGEGVQVVMPEFPVPAGSEVDVCFAEYYDLTDQVPPEYLNEAGTHFRVSIEELRQDPLSHHLVLSHNPSLAPGELFGAFSCRGGPRDGESCPPTDLAFCGEGFCASDIEAAKDQPVIADSVSCITFGPPGTFNFPVFIAQQSQERKEFAPGVYADIPLRGTWIWNSHSFNLTSRDHEMHARINFWFSDNPEYPVRSLASLDNAYAHEIPPYGSQTLCGDLPLARGARVFNLLGHTHQQGKRFWVEHPSGETIYENFIYNDPVNAYYDPPLSFDSPDRAERTLRYCGYYENGVGEDGKPDPSTVKRRSGTPPNAIEFCEPVACTAGRIGEACAGVDDHAACDSSPGAGDGECDACVTRGGPTTRDEMLILLGNQYIVPLD
jgi:hypothetical protein